MARRAKVKLTETEKRELEQLRRDLLALDIPVEEIEHKISVYKKFLLQNRSTGV
jgi:hypothetical protein